MARTSAPEAPVVRWAPLSGHEGKLEVSDARDVRRVSPWRGIGDTIRLEPVLSAAEVEGLGIDVEAAARSVWGEPAPEPEADDKAVTTTLVPASKDVEDENEDGDDDSGEDVDPEKPAKKSRARKSR